MAQSTTNLGKIHVFPSETLYNQFKDIIADNDLALLKDDGAYIVAALLEQNGYVKFSNGLILQWGFVHTRTTTVEFNIPFTKVFACVGTNTSRVGNAVPSCGITNLTNSSFTMSVFANDNVGTSDVTWMALGA